MYSATGTENNDNYNINNNDLNNIISPTVNEGSGWQAVELKLILQSGHFVSPGVAKVTCAAEVDDVRYQ